MKGGRRLEARVKRVHASQMEWRKTGRANWLTQEKGKMASAAASDLEAHGTVLIVEIVLSLY